MFLWFFFFLLLPTTRTHFVVSLRNVTLQVLTTPRSRKLCHTAWSFVDTCNDKGEAGTQHSERADQVGSITHVAPVKCDYLPLIPFRGFNHALSRLSIILALLISFGSHLIRWVQSPSFLFKSLLAFVSATKHSFFPSSFLPSSEICIIGCAPRASR
jgi:hypothetical protein